MDPIWRAEFLRLGALTGVAALVGWIAGSLAWGLVLGLLTYVAWMLRELHRIERWLHGGAKVTKAPDSQGVWDRVIQHVYDLKQRARQRKKRLSDLLSRFHRFTEAIPDATVLLKRNGEIEWSNSAARIMLGIRNPQDRGHRIDQLLRDPAFQRYLADGDYSEPLDIESPVEEDIELNLRIVPYGRSERLLTARDASTLRRLQAARREFVANVSHELRTPLTVVAGYLETLIDDPDLPDDARHQLRAMQSQSERMRHLVEDLLTLSRLEMELPAEQEFEPVNVAALAQAICAEARRLGEQHSIECTADDSLRLIGQNGALRSAFTNLVMNAVQHTPAGTHIKVVWTRSGAGALFDVSDDGPGIERHHLVHLTERFYRVDRSRSRASGGTGLGLAIAKHAVERHQGRLEIDSAPGQGARFSCWFPAQRLDGPSAIPLAGVINP